MLVAGLTGNYGMGKSTVLEMFRKLGAFTLDADRVVDTLLRESAVLLRVRETFGDAVFLKSGGLDRSALASVVFANSEKRSALERILHPLVFERIEAFLESMREEGGAGKIVIMEIPLLFEKGYTRGISRKITVFTDVDIALDRLAKEGVEREKAMKRVEAQMSIEEKISMADFGIDNSGAREDTERQVKNIYEKLLSDAGRIRE